MSQESKFIYEVTHLRNIKNYWSNMYRTFYYVSDSHNEYDGMKLVNSSNVDNQSYDWFESLDSIRFTSFVGIIVMRPAFRKTQNEPDDSILIFSQLLECLSLVHKAAILHFDIRPDNCLKFSDGWQVTDFDLAVPMTAKDVGLRSSGDCDLIIGTHQHRSAGYRMKEVTKNESSGSEVTVSWTVIDDIEMLHRSCNQMSNR